MPLEFRRHAQDKMVQRLKGDVVKPKTLTNLMHSYTGKSATGKTRARLNRSQIRKRRKNA